MNQKMPFALIHPSSFHLHPFLSDVLKDVYAHYPAGGEVDCAAGDHEQGQLRGPGELVMGGGFVGVERGMAHGDAGDHIKGGAGEQRMIWAKLFLKAKPPNSPGRSVKIKPELHSKGNAVT